MFPYNRRLTHVLGSAGWFRRGLFVFLAGILLLSACRPGGPPLPSTPEASPSPEIPAVENADLLANVDDNAALPPQVIERRPAGGEELALSGEVELIFDQPMDPEDTAAAWEMVGPEGERVPGEVSWPTEQTMRFAADRPLQSGALYRASLSTQATSTAGITLATPVEFQFDTVGELQVSQVFPADGTMEVESSAVITVIFNRPVVPLVITGEQANLPNPLTIDPPLAGEGEWVSTSVYTYRPVEALRSATTYQISVDAGLPDAAGETQLAEPYNWSFTTITPRLASIELTKTGQVNPEENIRPLHRDEAFALNFEQPMDRASTEEALSIESERGSDAPLQTTWNEDFTRVVITPTQLLDYGTAYTVRLDTSAQAQSGGPLEEELAWNFRTIPSPSVAEVSWTGGGFTRFSPELRIRFTGPMNIESVKERVMISPAPEEEFEWWYNDWDWTISAYVLEPSTQYEVTILPGMTDLWGTPVEQGQTVQFTTQPYDPQVSLQMPYWPALFRTDGPQEFYVSYRNINSFHLEMYSVSTEDFIALQSGTKDRWGWAPPAESLVWQTDGTGTGALNEEVFRSFLPGGDSGQPLPAGFYYLTLNSPDVPHDGVFLDSRLVIVASGNLTFKSTTNDGLIWLTGLESGRPLANVPLTVYDRNGQPIGQGVTDNDGLLNLELPTPEDPYEARYVLAGDQENFAFTSTEWGSGVNLYDVGIWSSYYAPANQPAVYVYTDRPVYRPGQPVYFKGIVRLDNDLDYRLPDAASVIVRIDSFQEMVYETELPLSEFGSFDSRMILDEAAAVGFYTISIRFPGQENPIGQGSFSVAEYRRPEFSVSVQAGPQDVLPGESITVDVAASYYSGGGVANAEVGWTLTASPYLFEPPGAYSSYSFIVPPDEFRFFEEPVGPSRVIAEGTGQADASGRLTLTLPAELGETGESQELVLEATFSDAGGSVASGRASVIAHRSSVYAGVKPQAYVGIAEREAGFDLAALDWNGEPVANQPLNVEIVERRWYSVQEQDATGRIRWTSSVEDIPVTSFEVSTDARGEAEVQFVPPKGGIYRAIVTTQDTSGNEARSAADLWVSGEEFVPWRQTNDRRFDLVPDRESYAPGDTAEILIASPFQGEAYALVTVERGRIRDRQVVLLTSNSTVFQLPITPDLAPNIYVSVLVVKGVDETNPRPDFRMGITELKVDTNQQALEVQIIPEPEIAGPGEPVTYTVRTLDAQGQPVNAELSLGLSDLATLSLADPTAPPILDYFYAHRTLGVWTSVPLVISIEDYNATIEEDRAVGEGMGSGGGKGDDAWGVIAVREDFPDTAYWEAHLVTGDDGEETVTVTLPDNLTTWRLDARAVTEDTLVGQAAHDLLSTKPLLVQAQTPRFFVAGDQARLGAAVHNNTDQDLSVDVSIRSEGVTLQAPEFQTVEVPSHQQAFVYWDVTVNPEAERVDLIFSAEAVTPDATYSDASRPMQAALEGQGLPVHRFTAPETVGTAGQLLEAGTLVEAISLPFSMPLSGGTLTVEVAPSLAAGMTGGLSYLEHSPYEGVEQTVSSFLPNVIATRALHMAGVSDPALEADLEERVSTALQRLYNWQNANGGWGWWRTEKSDGLTTAYVVLGLTEAQEAGYTVSEDVIRRGLGFLRTQLRDPQRMSEPHVLNRQAFLLYVLARTGGPDVSRTVQMYDARQGLTVYARALLADALHRIDSDALERIDADPRVQTLLSDIASNAIVSATGTHWEEGERDPWNWNTDTRTTAIVLSVLSRLDAQNPINANAVRWLMNHRSGNHWYGSQETAWSLMALANWMAASGELQADYRWAVGMNGQQLGGDTANAETLRQTAELKVAVADLLQDAPNRLAIARDGGPGNLYYTAHLNIDLPVEQIQPVDRGITISRSYYYPEDRENPVTEAQQGDLLLARLTVVVPETRHYLVVEDPLPAGLEAVDQSLYSSQQAVDPQAYDWSDVGADGFGWWYFDDIEIRDEKVLLSASLLPPGTYIYTYLVRAGTVGTFNTIPPTAQELYFPEVYGRGTGSLFTVQP